ncbi:hypothetical protein, partial [Klebsiella pneumoniae]|uniref:hypothetical protein n=1 Tax=Klebsiella pneumoniae TaxID=573 RepID=UPI0025A124CA
LVFWKNSKCQVLEKTICFTVGYSTKSMPGIKRYRLSLRAGAAIRRDRCPEGTHHTFRWINNFNLIIFLV